MSCPRSLFIVALLFLLNIQAHALDTESINACTTPPLISVQPSNQSTCLNGTVTFTVTASSQFAGTLNYQWQIFSGVWTDIPGPVGTAQDLVYGPVTAIMDGAQVRVIISEVSDATCNTTSDAATLSIGTATTISSITGNQTLCQGDPLTLQVKVSGMANYNYVWYKDGVPVQTIIGVTNTSNIYSLGSVTTADAGTYYVEVTSACSATPVTSPNIIVTVNSAVITSITSNPSPFDVCTGGSGDLTVAATGNNLSYQWQVDNGGGYANMGGETNTILSLTSIPITSNGYIYRAQVQSNGGCTVYSSGVTLTVSAATVITTQPSFSGPICEGQQLLMSVFASYSGVATFQWYQDGNLIPGAVSQFFNRNPSTAADAGVYTVTVQGGCGPALTSNPVTVTIIPTINAATPVSGSEVCRGSDGTVIISNSQTGVNYQGFIGATAVSAIIPGNGAVAVMPITAALMSPGNNTITIQATTATCGNAPLTATANVLVVDDIGGINGSNRVCDNQTTGQPYSITPVTGAASYVWTADNGATITSGQGTANISLDLGASPTMLTVAPQSPGGVTCAAANMLIGQINSYSGTDFLTQDEDTVCAGVSTITYTIQNPAAVTYSWNIPAGITVLNQSATSCTLTPDNAGVYTITVDRTHQCNPGLPSFSLPAVGIAVPVVDAGADQQLQGTAPAVLNGSGTTGILYASEWSSSSSSSVIANPTSLITNVTQQSAQVVYTLMISALINTSCAVIDQTVISYERALEIPNAFSPNQDGIHDNFVIQNIQFYPKAVLTVYNQWGELIYKSPPGYPSPWDGTRNGGNVVPVSAYYFVLELNEEGAAAISGTINIIQ